MPHRKAEVIRAACCVAGLDGRICPKESALLQRLAEASGATAPELRALMDRAESDPEFYKEQFRLVMLHPERAVQTLHEVAMADGEVGIAEQVIVQHFALDKLKMSYESLRALIKS